MTDNRRLPRPLRRRAADLTWPRATRTVWPSAMSLAAARCRNRSACSTSSSTTSGWLLNSISRTPRSTRRPRWNSCCRRWPRSTSSTRGFLDGTKRYAEQRARAEDLADRDKFRTALVNSLQEGFFVADHEGAVVDINNAFAEILGYPAEGLPYRWPHPWLVDKKTARRTDSPGSQPGQRRVRDTDSASRRPSGVGGGEHQCGHRARDRSGRLRRNHSRHHRRTGIRRPGKRGPAPGHGCGGGAKAWPRWYRSLSTSAGRRSTCSVSSRSCGRRATITRASRSSTLAGEPLRSDVARTRSVVAHDI